MCAHYRDIELDLAGRQLRLPTLNALVPDVHHYEILAFQTGGEVAAGPDFVGHADRANAAAKFDAFLQLALDVNADLVMTPEYASPWESLTRFIAQQKFPAPGKLWALACESITRADLQRLIAAHPQVEWVHEPIPNGAGRFFDILAYLAKAEYIGGGIRNVVVLQFKTHPMGGSPFEQANLILGSVIYFWRNPVDNIRLISLICSEALAFDQAAEQACRFNLHPFVVLHPQLNPSPRHADIRAYRSHLFAQQLSENVEVITLNWARGFVLLGMGSAYGGSTIYTKAQKFESSDARLEANHRKGLFYSHWHEHRTELCVFSFDEHVFHFRMPKAEQDVLAVEASRTGPEMLSLRHWDAATHAWIDSTHADDGFVQLCATFRQPGCDYCVNPPIRSVDRERLLTLTAGGLRPGQDWHRVEKIPSFIAEPDERTKRFTFTHEQAPDSLTFRHGHLAAFIKLQMTILPNGANFPPTIHELSGNWRLQPPRTEDGFRFNLGPRTGLAQGATAIFLGMVPPEIAHKLKDDLIRAWGRLETRRLVLWYEFQNAIRCLHPPVFNINDDLEPPASISGVTGA